MATLRIVVEVWREGGGWRAEVNGEPVLLADLGCSDFGDVSERCGHEVAGTIKAELMYSQAQALDEAYGRD